MFMLLLIIFMELHARLVAESEANIMRKERDYGNRLGKTTTAITKPH